jgi:hypothetical protein
MTSTKEIFEKIHIFFNLLYHLDDYIKNKSEKKGQLRVSKNTRLILREIISSKINLNYFINNEEIDSLINLMPKKDKRVQKYIQQINPLSFNQNNLDTISLFYNSNSEIYILNYLILEKIFSIIRFCFFKTMKQKNQEFQEKMKKNNLLNFVLYQYNEIKNNDINDINNMDKKYNLLKSIMNNKIKKKKIKKEIINISDINNVVQDINKKYSINKYKNNNILYMMTNIFCFILIKKI